ncbi:MAG: phosphoribosylanthranilate isomerase [Phycisphaeraceae bacterium]
MSVRTRIKICGIRQPDHARAAVAAGADAIGMVFVEGSPRRVTLEEARAVAAAVPAFVDLVGLFADHPVEEIREIAEATGICTIQLHGHESPGILEQLRDHRVIKALPFTDDAFAQHGDWLHNPRVRAILWDTPPEADGAWGGTGKKLPWHHLAQLLDTAEAGGWPPAILAGGLNAENVGDAIATVHPYAVDVSSGVESARGNKDIPMIATFCRAVRAADATR